MSNNLREIAELLITHRRLKADLAANRAKMIRAAVDYTGIPQEQARVENLEVFLDGYLIGAGMNMAHRVPTNGS